MNYRNRDGDMEPHTITTWRTTLPMDRDAVCLQIIEYRVDDKGDTRRFVLQLTPTPRWVEFGEGDVIPESTVELSGHYAYLYGGMPKPYDPRQTLVPLIERQVKEAITAVMDLRPAVEFTDAPT